MCRAINCRRLRVHLYNWFRWEKLWRKREGLPSCKRFSRRSSWCRWNTSIKYSYSVDEMKLTVILTPQILHYVPECKREERALTLHYCVGRSLQMKLEWPLSWNSRKIGRTIAKRWFGKNSMGLPNPRLVEESCCADVAKLFHINRF